MEQCAVLWPADWRVVKPGAAISRTKKCKVPTS